MNKIFNIIIVIAVACLLLGFSQVIVEAIIAYTL